MASRTVNQICPQTREGCLHTQSGGLDGKTKPPKKPSQLRTDYAPCHAGALDVDVEGIRVGGDLFCAPPPLTIPCTLPAWSLWPCGEAERVKWDS